MRNQADLQHEPEQIDWVTLDDKRASLRRMRKAAAERVGIPQLAHILEQDPSTIRNQLAYREGKQPSAELDDLCWLLDSLYRSQRAGATGEVLSRPPDLEPTDALREIAVRAQSSWDKRALAEVNEIMARVRR